MAVGLSFLLLASLTGISVCYELTLLHTNDVHARIDQMNKNGGQCSEDDAIRDKCFGGFARLKTKVKEIRASRTNTLFLDGGDQYSGTVWFYKFKGLGIARFTNHLGYDAMALGNHEFDSRPEGLLPFLDNANFSVLSANIRVDPNSVLVGKFQTSHVFSVGGDRIGVVGYTTPDTPAVSNPGPHLIFEDEVAAVQSEVTSLTEQGVNRIIALGHSGFEVDKRIAASVEGVDVVIGGHDNTFLHNGKPPSIEKPKGEYPYVVTQSSGAKVLAVQDYKFGKYLGVLHITFDDEGVVTSWNGNPILLDSTIEQDPATLTFLEPFKQEVLKEADNVIGQTHVKLESGKKPCRVKECNLGNLITDSMVRKYIKQTNSSRWTDVSIAILESGSIRTSIDKGDINMGQAGTLLPFNYTIDVVEIYGRHLLEALEHSASKLGTEKFFGGFLQVSGLKIEYDYHRPVGSRVSRARALCTRCEIPKYEDIQKDTVYKVVMNSFLARGGNNYEVIRDNKIRHHVSGNLDLDLFVDYVKKYTPIINGEDGRIIFRESDNCHQPTSTGTLPTASLTFLLTVILLPDLC